MIYSKPDCFDLSDEFQCRKIEPGPSYQVFLFKWRMEMKLITSLLIFIQSHLTSHLFSALHLSAPHQQHRQDHHWCLRRYHVNSWHQWNIFHFSGLFLKYHEMISSHWKCLRSNSSSIWPGKTAGWSSTIWKRTQDLMLSPHRHDLEIDNQKIKCGFINHLEFPQTKYICVDIIVSDWDIGEGAEPSVWIFQHSAKGHPAEWWLRLGMIGKIMNLLFVCLLDHRAHL